MTFVLGLTAVVLPVGGSSDGWNVYRSDEWQFEIAYPMAYGIVNEERANARSHLEFRVSFGNAFVPRLTVEVLANPEHLDVDEFAYETIRPRDRREIGIEEIIVAGVNSIRATWFAEAGEGCATAEVYIPHGEHMYHILSYCASSGLPHALASFRFLQGE